MSVTADILATYRHPRRTLRRQLAGGVREDRALVYLMLACLLIFVAQWPRLARQAEAAQDVPLEAMIGAALLSWLFFMPLVFYGLAAFSHLVARLFSGRGSWFSARLALFWTLLCVSPLWLVQGLATGFFGAGMPVTAISAILAVAFFFIWAATLTEAEGGAVHAVAEGGA